MAIHNTNNERIKRQYLTYLKEAKRQNESTIDSVAKALARFEDDTNCRDFKSFHIEQAIAFKRRLANQESLRTGERLSQATLYSTLMSLKRFFQWLAGQPGYKSKLRYSDAEYFNLSEKASRIATARREKPAPTIEQIKHVLSNMPATTEIEQRNAALLAFALLTGARDSAIASIKLKHLDLAAGCIHQDAREVKTKFSKTFTTYFFPVGDDIQLRVAKWATYLRQEKLWGNDDPLFPSTAMRLDSSHQFQPSGLDRRHWGNASPIRSIFREAFTAAGLPYFNPHSFRTTLTRLGETLCRSPEEFKAWSQNLGHEGVMTTFISYGSVSPTRQCEILATLHMGRQQENTIDLLANALFERLNAQGKSIDRQTTGTISS